MFSKYRNRSMVAFASLFLCTILVLPAGADWNQGDLAKWVQEPDLSMMGIDVNASVPFILADDFLCTERGYITGIHIWGSWRGDHLPFEHDPNAVRFVLSIHKDIPAEQSPTGFSMPGVTEWYEAFMPGQYSSRVWMDGIEEGWMDPPDMYVWPGDWTCWQYNFNIPIDLAFFQEGTESEPVVYWLDVQAFPEDPTAFFGWKTSMMHWNDDAVWGTGEEPYPGPWQELIYPPGHEQQGQSIDLSFVIQSQPPDDELDFGDAPDPAYPTLSASGGANHLISPNIFLGALIDAEPDGQPDPAALGDDNSNLPDEDGVFFATPLIPGQPAIINVTASVAGFLDAWVDWEGDGSWAGNALFAGSFSLLGGLNTININVPASAAPNLLTYARFRFSTIGGLSYTGGAPDGEVEDYQVFIEQPPEELDLGDAPDPTYPTLLASAGASHLIVPNIFLGALIDAEPDGQPDPAALGDDNAGLPDEDGVFFSTPLIPGQIATIIVTASAPGFLDAWIDWEVDGSWAGNALFAASYNLLPGPNTINFGVPAVAAPGTMTFARFRYSTAGGLPFTGWAPDGEVEDYRVVIEDQPQTYKWEQRPDLDITGIDIHATEPFILADDFLCNDTGYITTIGIWGSWLDDFIPFHEDPSAVRFILSIHADIPAEQNPDGYSIPGEPLWAHDFDPGMFSVEPYASGIEEGYMVPPDDYLFPADWTCWYYEFHIDPSMAFLQLGTPEQPIVYWLDVQALPLDINARFGWKTSVEHWNDDAVWGTGYEPYPGPWRDLIYPPQHPWIGESIDLAFRINHDPVQLDLDYGDAPDPTFPTLRASDGARHLINPAVFLGWQIDAEPDGQPTPNANGDDFNGLPDEDGVFFLTPLNPGAPATVDVIASTNGFIDAWIDFNGDGDWDDVDDRIFAGQPVNPGVNTLTFPVPANGLQGHLSYARFRFATQLLALSYTGLASDGEVEDYEVYIQDDVSSVPDDLMPQTFGLYLNRPNPFSPETAIFYDIPAEGARVTLEVFTVEGRLVRTLVDGFMPGGRHAAVWRGVNDAGRRVPAGLYLYRFKAPGYEMTRKMMMIQ
ncbi:MAG: hypothetical protein KJ927_10855 [Candidatus Eisenbacteria bacterium]|nr:hypothetical protein [Candidatus Eisenbacteria bacterium]